MILGRLHAVMDDGAEGEAGPGDVYEISAGHDAWVDGDESYVAVDFSKEIAGYRCTSGCPSIHAESVVGRM